jgi:hypothetical protein
MSHLAGNPLPHTRGDAVSLESRRTWFVCNTLPTPSSHLHAFQAEQADSNLSLFFSVLQAERRTDVGPLREP